MVVVKLSPNDSSTFSIVFSVLLTIVPSSCCVSLDDVVVADRVAVLVERDRTLDGREAVGADLEQRVTEGLTAVGEVAVDRLERRRDRLGAVRPVRPEQTLADRDDKRILRVRPAVREWSGRTACIRVSSSPRRSRSPVDAVRPRDRRAARRTLGSSAIEPPTIFFDRLPFSCVYCFTNAIVPVPPTVR